MHGQVIEPPNTKDHVQQLKATCRRAPTIQTGQTRENNVAEEEPCKASIRHSSASRTSEVAIYAEYYRLSNRFS
jgi:hypothetical protein